MIIRKSKNKSRVIKFKPRNGFDKCEDLMCRCTKIGLKHGDYIIIYLLKQYYAVSINGYGINRFIVVCKDYVCYTNKQGYFYFESVDTVKLNSDDSIPYKIDKLSKSSAGYLKPIYEDIIRLDKHIQGAAFSKTKNTYYDITDKRYFQLYVGTLCRLFYVAEFSRDDLDIIYKYFPYHKDEITKCFSKKHILTINPFKHEIKTEKNITANYNIEPYNQLHIETKNFKKEKSKVMQKMKKYSLKHPLFKYVKHSEYKNIKNYYINLCKDNFLSLRFTHCDEYYMFKIGKLYESGETTASIKKHIKLKINEHLNKKNQFTNFEDILYSMGFD